MSIAAASAAIVSNPNYRMWAARTAILDWIRSGQPLHDRPEESWAEHFDYLGPFWCSVHDRTQYNGGQLTIERLEPLEFAPPTKLFRGATERARNGWSWTPMYSVAQENANTRGEESAVWSASPGRVYGCVDVQVDFPASDATDELSVTGTLWIMRPENVQMVNRWTHPDLMEQPAPEWADRDITKAEALALLGTWTLHNHNLQSHLENFGIDFWRGKFNQMGQFTADATGPELRIAPTRNLKPGKLYRGAVTGNENSIAWTTEVHTAVRYAGFRGDAGRVWTADAAHVYGRILWPGFVKGEPYWEWLIEPTNIRPLEPT